MAFNLHSYTVSCSVREAAAARKQTRDPGRSSLVQTVSSFYYFAK